MNYVLHHSLQNGVTPLILASQEGHKDIVVVLLNHGAEVDLPDKVSVCVSYCYLNSESETSLFIKLMATTIQ